MYTPFQVFLGDYNSIMVPSPTVSEVIIPFQMIPSPTIIIAYGSLPDPAKMIIPTKIFSTSVVEVKVTQSSLTIHANVVTAPGSFIAV